MGFKDKDLEKFDEMLCSLLSSPSHFRTMINRICKGNEEIATSDYPNTPSRNVNSKLQLQINQLQQQLKETQNECQQYKNSYKQSIDKISIYEKNIETLEKDKSKLNQDIDSCVSENRNLNSKISTLETEINLEQQEKKKYNDALVKASDIISDLKFQISAPMSYLDKYRNLPFNIRDGLSNVISDTNVVTFIASCSENDNLKAIWNYIKDMLGDNNSQSINTLIEIFDYFFEIFNNSLSEPKYARDNVELGDDLDDEYYDRSRGSSTSGPIKEILLRGYKSRNTGRIICKSVVKA